MSADQFTALLVFAAVSSFTPGPNNTIATVTGANHGLRAVLPHMLGVPFGFATMLVAGAAGVAVLILAVPVLAALIKWAGIAYLCWLAWKLANSRSAGELSAGPFSLPLRFHEAALFQYLNPKAWMFAMAVVSAYAGGERPGQRVVIMVLVCAACAFASLVLWGWLGASLRHWLAQGARLLVFNRVMAASLAATAVWMGLASA
jgi:threonine/homoserine/homoserine lactone efflux protein